MDLDVRLYNSPTFLLETGLSIEKMDEAHTLPEVSIGSAVVILE